MGNVDWQTPLWFFEACDRIWGPFDVDAAADESNKLCLGLLDKAFDAGGGRPWPFENKRVWLNPPYRNMAGWVETVIEEAKERNNTTVLLGPIPRGDMWMIRLRAHAEIVEIDGRLKFIDPEKKGRAQPVGGNILAIARPPLPGVIWPTGYTGTRLNLFYIQRAHEEKGGTT